MRTLTLLLGLVLCGGCDRKPKRASAACEKAAPTVRMPSATADQEQVARATVVTRCIEDKWSAAATTCFAAGSKAANHADCLQKHLTADQWQRLGDALNALLPEPPASEIQARLAKSVGFKDAMCACREAACVQRVTDEMSAWTMNAPKQYRWPPTLSAEDRQRAMQVGDELTTCMLASMRSSRPPTDAQRYVAKNAEFKDRLCACTDAACGEAVAAELTSWSEEFVKSPGDGSTMSQADQDRLEVIERDVKACLRSLRASRK